MTSKTIQSTSTLTSCHIQLNNDVTYSSSLRKFFQMFIDDKERMNVIFHSVITQSWLSCYLWETFQVFDREKCRREMYRKQWNSMTFCSIRIEKAAFIVNRSMKKNRPYCSIRTYWYSSRQTYINSRKNNSQSLWSISHKETDWTCSRRRNAAFLLSLSRFAIKRNKAQSPTTD